MRSTDHKALRRKLLQKRADDMATVKHIPYPLPDLKGPKGNAYYLLGQAASLMKEAGIDKSIRSQFRQEATSGDYKHLLATIQDWFALVRPVVTYEPFDGDVNILVPEDPDDEDLDDSVAAAAEEYESIPNVDDVDPDESPEDLMRRLHEEQFKVEKFGPVAEADS